METENEKTEEKEILDKKEEKINNKIVERQKVEIELKKLEEVKQTEIDKEIKTIEKKKGSHAKEIKTSKKFIIIAMIVIIFLIFLSTIFAIINIKNNNIVKGIYIENLEVSNMSRENAKNIVNEKISKIKHVELYYGDYNKLIKLEDIGVNISSKEAIQKAISVGKSNNIIKDNFYILKSMLFKTNIELEISINEEKFSAMIKNIQVEIPNSIKQYSYEINDEELIITSGKAGNKINSEELKNKILEGIKEQFNGANKAIDIPVNHLEPEKINIEKIYEEIYKEAKDAYIEEDPFKLYKEENGIDFAITKEQAQKIINENKEIYSIPLKITKPKVAVKDLGDKLFNQSLSKYTTIYDAGNANRSHNVALAAKTLNGTILLPGETFSYNGRLGNTNAAKGYKQATAYVAGKVVPSYGGGICQVSSTLYNAVLYANLEIVERYNHSYVVNYVPAGRDATVAYGGKDFKFKNTRSYPIKIVSSAKNGVVSISIMGIKEKNEYEVVLTSTVLSTTPNKTVYENNSDLAEGIEKVIQKGYTGKTSIAYKILKHNGKTISKTVLSKDTYKPMNKIVERGTKKVQVPVVSVPTQSQPSETTINTQTSSITIDTNTII